MHNGDDGYFQRNRTTESSIDQKIARNSLNFESVSVFLDVLDDIKSEKNAFYRGNSLDQFLKYRKLSIEKSMDAALFNLEERNYIEELRAYLKKIRIEHIGSKFSRQELIWHFLNILKRISGNSTSLDQKIEELNNEISKFQYLSCRVYESSGNVYMHILKYDYYICLINDYENYKVIDSRSFASLVVNGGQAKWPDSISKATNIDILSYRTENGDFSDVIIRNPFNWCHRQIQKALRRIELTHEREFSEKVKGILFAIESNISETMVSTPSCIIKTEHLRLDDIKRLRNIVFNSSRDVERLMADDLGRKISNDLRSISNVLSSTYNRVKNVLDLNHNISAALSEIRRNNTLYIVSGAHNKSMEYTFGEENLTSILASNMRCLYKDHVNISIVCEAKVGNGRSDISFSFGNEIFGIVESKLIKERSDVTKETLNAIDQLYARYGDNRCVKSDANLKLYLIMFSYDKTFPKMSEAISNAAEIYSERNNLIYTQVEKSENGIKFTYEEKRGDFESKIRMISIIVCNMEVDYKTRSKERTRKKTYAA